MKETENMELSTASYQCLEMHHKRRYRVLMNMFRAFFSTSSKCNIMIILTNGYGEKPLCCPKLQPGNIREKMMPTGRTVN